MRLQSPRRVNPSRLARCLLILAAACSCPAPRAQTSSATDRVALPAAPTHPTIPALLLSDIHFDPFHDPAKLAGLNTAPAADWPRILAAPSPPPPPPARLAALNACTTESDTSYTLWQSTLAELRRTAASSRFAVISGDLLAHRFDCKYKALVPGATQAGYLAFTVKTVAYILASLRTALPAVPIYTALGNNDSGCTDYSLDARHDAFLAAVAPLIAQAANLIPADRTPALPDFSAIGAFNVPLAALPHTRIIALDDLYLSARYTTCAGKRDPAPAAAAIAWLKAQLDSARAAHDRVWFVGHIPPGVDLYTTARLLTDVCGGAKPTMFLASEDLAQTLVDYSGVVTLALFGHTHGDELRLLTPDASSSAPREGQHPTNNGGPATQPGVPLKITASITPVHGNRPSFTLARVDPATATLVDYTVIISSDPAELPIAWSPEYTFSATYRQPAFDPASLTALIAGFQADPAARSPASQAYIRNYFPAPPAAADANSAVISAAWQPYACSLNHNSAKSFAACACAK